MTRDEVRELLPLLAGGDLDEDVAAAAWRVVQEDEALMAELEGWRTLDGALATALAPGAEAPGAEAPGAEATGAEATGAEATGPTLAAGRAGPRTTPAVVVRRRCPYCHDAIAAEALVVCASCATPHHAPCFEANAGCSLLGCGSAASIAAAGPASTVCAGCGNHTPQGAPFCAWCGAGLAGPAAAPRHTRATAAPPAYDWRRYAAAAALLLASTVGGGGLFGLQQREVLGMTAAALLEAAEGKAEASVPALLEVLGRVQALYRDGPGRGQVAPDLGALHRFAGSLDREWGRPEAARSPTARLAARLDELWSGVLARYHVDLHVAPDGGRWCLAARPAPRSPAHERSWALGNPAPASYFAADGHVWRVRAGSLDIDDERCVLRTNAAELVGWSR